MKKFNFNWYLIYTRPRHEKKVHARLCEINIHSFLPTRKVLRVWHDRRKFVSEPLFPSYVFTYLNTIEDYYKAINTEGALYYVKFGKEVATVSEAVINNLKLVVSQTQDIEVTENQFQQGQWLVIKNGAFTGLSCEVVQCDSKQKVLVRVDLLKRNIILTVPEEYLMPV